MEHTQRQKLELQADRIDTVLATYRIPARVSGGTVTPHWSRFQVMARVGTKMSTITRLDEEIAHALGASTCRITRQGAAITIEIPRDDPVPVRFQSLYDQLCRTEQPTHATALLGLGHDGNPLLIHLPSPDAAHILIAGTTGSGKTVLMRTMITSLALSNKPHELTMLLIDPKTIAFAPFAVLPHLAHPIATTPNDAAALLQRLVCLMEHRTTPNPRPTIALFIDELADIAMTGGQPVLHAITRLIQRGREAGIHVIAATQKPSASLLGPLFKANFPVRLVGRVTSIDDARVAAGQSATGAERLLGRGDFIALAEGTQRRFHGAYITTDQITHVTSALDRRQA